MSEIAIIIVHLGVLLGLRLAVLIVKPLAEINDLLSKWLILLICILGGAMPGIYAKIYGDEFNVSGIMTLVFLVYFSGLAAKSLRQIPK